MIYTLELTDNEVGGLFAYLFALISTQRYKEVVPEGYKLKQDVIDTSGYLLKNCKLYAYRYHYCRERGLKAPPSKLYGVHPKDKSILQRLNLSAMDIDRYKAMTMKKFEAKVAKLLTCREFVGYLKAFIYKKHTFLVRSYGDTYDNIQAQLIEKALYHLYKTYPRFDSDLHMLNVAKRAAHNAGIDYIRTKTTQKNSRLSFDNGNYVPTVLPIEAAQNVAAGESGRINAPCLSNFKFTARVRHFLALMQGVYDEGFSLYLNQRNDEYVHTVSYNSYQKQVVKYLGLSDGQVSRLFERIRGLRF